GPLALACPAARSGLPAIGRATAARVAVGRAAVPAATAIIPGNMTRNGMNIFGSAAIRGVRRAASIEFAAIARCTTRKSVHQYPNESTKPSPITSPTQVTPIGLREASPIFDQE